MWVCTSISPGNPVYFERSIISAPEGIAVASLVTVLMCSPSTMTMAFVHSFPRASHNFPNRTALTGLALGFSCAQIPVTQNAAKTSPGKNRIGFIAPIPSVAGTSAAQRLTSNSVIDGMQSGRGKLHCWRRAVGAGAIVAVELTGCRGGAAPAVCEPSPNCWSVFASSFPVGFSPCDSWNFFVASAVAASHFPLGVPVNEPSFASAFWISEIRSGAGVFCPRSRRCDFLEDFVRCNEAPDFEDVDLLGVAACASTDDAPARRPATHSSASVGFIDFCKRIRIGTVQFSAVIASLLLLIVRRHFTRQIERQNPVAVLPAKDLENDILALLQPGHCFAVVGNGIHLLAVDFRDDVAAAESQIFGKRRRVDFGYQHALLPFYSYAVAALRRQLFHVQPEFRRRRFARLIAHPASHIREHSGAVLDNSRGLALLGLALLVLANVLDLDLAPNRRLRNGIDQVIPSLHRAAVHAGDHVAALQASLLRRTPGLYTLDRHAIRRAQRLQRNRIGPQFFLEANADGSSRHAALLDDLVAHVECGWRGQRKADSFITAAARNDRGIDADHFTGEVDQRSTRISRINCRIGLQESLELLPESSAALCADDSRGHRGLQPEGAANRKHPVPDLHAVRISELGDGQFLVRIDLDHREVRVFIHTDDLSRVPRRVPIQLHLDFRGLFHNVVVGQDVPAFIHDHA